MLPNSCMLESYLQNIDCAVVADLGHFGVLEVDVAHVRLVGCVGR